MSLTKYILKKYFENPHSKEIQSLFVSWLKRKKNNPEIDEALKEMWNEIDIPADNLTHGDLSAIKQRLKMPQPDKHRYKLSRIAIYASASCIILFVISMFTIFKPDKANIERENIFAQLNATQIDSIGEITVIAGNVITIKENDNSIKQTKDGGIIINEKKEVDVNDINTEMIQVIVPKGRRSQVRFNDGTVAWVNSGSKLIYPKKFDDKKRDIYIDGELYLEVAQEAQRPFIVNTQTMNIKVLGTEFNIRSYAEESEKSVVLVEGKVEVESSDKKSKDVLLPNQGIFFKDNLIEKKQVDVNSYICWKDGELRLDGESLRTIFDRLSKCYNINIAYSEKDKNKQYKGRLFLGDSIEEVLNTIAVKVEFTYKKENDTIYIYKKKS